MVGPSNIRRRLFMHQAHRTVGVSGGGVAIGPYCRMERPSIANSTAATTHVVLAACPRDADTRAALASFRRTIGRRPDIECSYVDLDALRAGWTDLSDADCLIVLDCGLYVAQHRSDLDAAAIAPLPHLGRGASGDLGPMTVEVATAARRHPALEGVEPFTSHPIAPRPDHIPPDATVLLTHNTPTEVFPIAWVTRGGHGPVFSTSLGSAEDFHQPAFVRLVLNVLTWIGR